MACCHHRTGRIEMRNGTDREGAHGVARTAQPVLKMQVGDIIPVKVLKIDELGRINLSLKAAKRDLEGPGKDAPAA